MITLNWGYAMKEQITKYKCMIGQLQWAVTLCRYYILACVMSMSGFRLAPKIGHLEILKRIYEYLSETKHFAIRYRTKEPNYSHLPVQGEIPRDIPKL